MRPYFAAQNTDNFLFLNRRLRRREKAKIGLWPILGFWALDPLEAGFEVNLRVLGGAFLRAGVALEIYPTRYIPPSESSTRVLDGSCFHCTYKRLARGGRWKMALIKRFWSFLCKNVKNEFGWGPCKIGHFSAVRQVWVGWGPPWSATGDYL